MNLSYFIYWVQGLFLHFDETMLEVIRALAPLFIVFILFQMFSLKLPKRKVKAILMGMFLVFLGLSFFMQGVHIGFNPAGLALGENIAGLPHRFILIPIGFLMGFSATMAEPAIRILNEEVEKVSGGHIRKNIMLYTICLGVGVSIALAMTKLLLGISLWYMILPGYMGAIFLARYVSREFVGIAFDSGGVATGPMVVTFIMSMSVGAAKIIPNRDPLLDGFGLVSLVALTPILCVLFLGFLYDRKEKADANP
jgi:hypothetical protein